MQKLSKGLLIVIIISGFFFIGAMTSYYTVEPDEKAVIIRFGKFHSIESPGLHFKLPFGIDQKIIVNTEYRHQAEFGFRTSGVQNRRTQYSENEFDEESLILTGDLNVVDIEWVVQYKIADPFKYLFKAKDPEQNIRDVSESIMRRIVGDMLVNDILTSGKEEIGSSARVHIQEVLDKYDLGIQVEMVIIQAANPPGPVKLSFDEVNEAKQEQEKLINQAEQSYNKVIPEAKGKADELVSSAEGYALALKNRAAGDAEKFSAIYNEYRKSPEITKKRIYIETMEEMFQRFKSMTVVDDKVKGLLPIFQNSQLMQTEGEGKK